MAMYKDLKNTYRYPAGKTMPGQSGWISEHLIALRRRLNDEIKRERKANSLILGSWNIRHFDGKNPRMPESYHYIAEIIDHFDICALQEVKSKEAVDRLVRLLGPNWDYFINDSGGGGRANHERMAFLYDTNKVRFRNLIGELVISHKVFNDGEQLARTPFFASFQAGWFRFTLCSAHIVFGTEAGRPLREEEIDVIAEELAKRAKKEDEVYIFLGDMNIDDEQHPGFAKLLEHGFKPAKIGPTNLGGDKYYDQIAFTGPEDVTNRLRAGVFNFLQDVFVDDEVEAYQPFAENLRRDRKTSEDFWDYHRLIQKAVMEGEMVGKPYADWRSEYKSWRTHEMSDHLPIWIELRTDYSDEYLEGIA